MNLKSTGYWNLKKEKLKMEYPFITEEDLIFNNGKEKVMMEKLAYKLGKSTDEFRHLLAAL